MGTSTVVEEIEVESEEDLVTNQVWEGERDRGVGVDSACEACVEMQAIIQAVAGCPVWGGRVKELVGAECDSEKCWQPQCPPINPSQWGTLRSQDWMWASQEACCLLCFIRSQAACLNDHISGFQIHYHY